LAEITNELDALSQQSFNQTDRATALESVHEIWMVLNPVEQADGILSTNLSYL